MDGSLFDRRILIAAYKSLANFALETSPLNIAENNKFSCAAHLLHSASLPR